ncbi:hypothetical protein [Algoriphagus lacus]|nr:hypothetical protein [Algoriphagus lacus]
MRERLQLFFLVLIFVSLSSFPEVLAQETQREPLIRHFNGTITATNNGISLIPSFTLGKPAVFFDLSVGGERLSFDPMFRFGMDGKPWAFVFWWRYKVVKDRRFTLNAGAHPAFIFSEMPVMVDGKEEKMLVTKRFLAGELTPMYKVSNRFSFGLYYLQGHGFNPTPPYNTNFLALNAVFSELPLFWNMELRVNPQFFFLRVDDTSGTYVTSTFALKKNDFPIGITSTMTQKINSTVPGDDFVWNVGLYYNFANDYKKD